MKNKAFTLAETLIVLSIIGILATIMLSAMSKMAPDREKVLFKKAYQTVEKTVGELVNDENLYPYDPNKIGFANTELVTWPGSDKKYGGGSTDTEATEATKFCRLFERKLNVIESASTKNDCSSFQTSDGIQYTLANWTPDATKSGNTSGANGANAATLKMKIDINGDKTPNKDNVDIFYIYVDYDGRVSVRDDVEKEYLKSSNARKE